MNWLDGSAIFSDDSLQRRQVPTSLFACRALIGSVDYVSDRRLNPFGLDPPCEDPVYGFGDPAADFHVIGDNPAVHGGQELGIPFTGNPWSASFFEALHRAGLVQEYDLEAGEVEVAGTYLSYLSMCPVASSSAENGADQYDRFEPYFDAELRAITADVLLPVGRRAIRHVFESYTSQSLDGIDPETMHASDLAGAGWLVVPIKDPGDWHEGDDTALVETLQSLQEGNYRQVSDLGRFQPGGSPYFVR